MSDRPGVTVALPVFNGRALVAGAIDSVLCQEGWDLHLVVVDDGSSDGSGDLLSERAAGDARIEVIRLPTNCGVAHARNVAVAARQDPLVAFIDQDDRWRPDRLDVGWRALSSAPELDYVLAHQMFERPTGATPRWVRERWLEGPQQGHVLGTLLAWRDRAWNAVGPLDETLRFGADDVDWFARAQDLGLRRAMLPEVLLDRGLHADNASARTKENTAELVAVLRAKLHRRDRGEGQGE